MNASEIQAAFDRIVTEKSIKPHPPRYPGPGRGHRPQLIIDPDVENPQMTIGDKTYPLKHLKVEFVIDEEAVDE